MRLNTRSEINGKTKSARACRGSLNAAINRFRGSAKAPKKTDADVEPMKWERTLADTRDDEPSSAHARLGARQCRPARSSDAAVTRVSGLRKNVIACFRTWLYRTQYRRELCQFDYRMLRDVGITADAVDSECRKPFWRS